MAKAYSSVHTTLKCSRDPDNLERICRIKSYPALNGVPDALETTDLQDFFQTFTRGVEQVESMEFTSNYTPEEYASVMQDAWRPDMYYQLDMGVNGYQGRFKWQGSHSVRLVSSEVNGVVEMVITVIPTTRIEKNVFSDPDGNGNINIEPGTHLFFEDDERDGNVVGDPSIFYLFLDPVSNGNIEIVEA
jgi:hypothetical protein